MATKKFSPAQLAAQKLFAERARSGTLKKGKRKTNPGLYDNINAKRARIRAGSGERMRKPGSKGAPTQAAFEQSAMTAKHNPEGRSIFNLGGGYFGSVSMSGYNEYYAQVFYRTTDSSGSTDDQIVPDYKPRYFTTAKSAVGSLMRYKTKNLGRKTNPEKVTQVYTVFHRGTSNVAGTVRETSPKAAKEKIANRLGLPTLTYLVARKGERLQNPDKAKPRAYVNRVSQATGAPPSKRLVTRRKMALTAPAGYFPNPKTSPMVVGYQVICMHPKKHVIGVFKTLPQAKEMAKALADYGGVPYAIKKVKIHKTHFMVHDLAIM